MSERLIHPRFGLDYTSPISPAGHRAAGSSFACRYLSHDPSKDIHKAEADALYHGGIDVVTVWETTADRALAGYDAGVQDAVNARDQAHAAGMPAGRPIYFAVDFDSSANPAVVDGYFDGVASVLTKDACGPYGGFDVVRHLIDRGFRYAWQTYAWSRGMWDDRAQLRQFSNDHVVAGQGVDYNHAMYADFAQWHYTQPPPPVNHHYARFSQNERPVVEAYDKLMASKTRALHRGTLHHYRREMLALATRIWEIAHQEANAGEFPLPIDWSYRARGWRFHQLRDRGTTK